MNPLVNLPELGARATGASKDPRYLRTRAVISTAFSELLATNKMEAISVQMIAKLAGINLGTFYDHFPTRWHLYNEYLRNWFRSLVNASFAGKPEGRPEGLGCLIYATIEALTTVADRCQITRVSEPIAYGAIQEEIQEFVIDWLHRQTGNKEISELVSVASASSWAIFGCALEWSRSTREDDPQGRADEVRNFMMWGLTSVINTGVTSSNSWATKS